MAEAHLWQQRQCVSRWEAWRQRSGGKGNVALAAVAGVCGGWGSDGSTAGSAASSAADSVAGSAAGSTVVAGEGRDVLAMY